MVCGGLVVSVCIGGCSSSPKPGGKTASGGSTRAGGTADTLAIPVVKHPPGVSGFVAVRTAVLPLGQVPYDNLSLPIVSPDGLFIATQTGLAPTWPTVLAGAEANVPSMTRIETYRLDRRTGIDEKDRKDPELLSTLSEPALLGRSCDASGFLVESPRSDGSRWIGKVSWSSGDITWLVHDTKVNAFACMGPDGRLAWSRRTVDGLHFELVVRRTGGAEEWTMPAQDDDWLMPVWSGRGDGLFVMHLQTGSLERVYANAASMAAFRQSFQKSQLVTGATVNTAYDALSSAVTVADGPPPIRDQLVYYNPSVNRASFWRPLGEPGRRSMFLNPGSITAVLDEEELAIVATDKALIRQRLSNYSQRLELLPGASIPRATWASDWPYMLLAPLPDKVGITAMRLLPMEAPAKK